MLVYFVYCDGLMATGSLATDHFSRVKYVLCLYSMFCFIFLYVFCGWLQLKYS